MNLANLIKKLEAANKKLAAVVKLNCYKLARKIAVEITRLEGKIEEAIAAAKTEEIKPKYTWELKEEYGICKNNENGNKYHVSARVCSCPDWQKRRRFTGDNCKHQLMYFDLVGQPAKKEILIDENACPTGTWLRRTDDWMSVEYEVWCYQEKYHPRCGFEIEQTCVGRIIQGKNEIFAATLRSMSRGFTSTENAINYLLRYSGLDPNKIAKTYSDKHPRQVYDELEPEPEKETKKKRTWLSLQDLVSS